jgi:hypothetical protein
MRHQLIRGMKVWTDDPGYPAWVSYTALVVLVALIPLAILFGQVVSPWILPGLMAVFLVFGLVRKIRIYEVFVEETVEGFQEALCIISYMVAILVTVGILRASGGLGVIVTFWERITNDFGLPSEALPMTLMRPLFRSSAYGILAS